MKPELERDLGEQPIATIMAQHCLDAHKLVEASKLGLTHKMVARAKKGRRLTPNVKTKVRAALSEVLGRECKESELFNY